MKKSLSITNSQGIYVARASFSSDETIIDFVKNNTNNESSSSRSNNNIVNSIALPIEQNIETQSIQSLPTSPTKRSKRRNPVNKVLKILHLKRKSTGKMDEHANDDVASTSSSSKFPKRKGRTATLVKKISIVKRSGDGGNVAKKSAIPLRSATSVETISHLLTANSPTAMSTTTATLSLSEMSLVNIDYRQEESRSNGGGGNNVNVDVKLDRRTHFENIRSRFDGGGNGGSGDGKVNVIDRTYGSSSKIPTGRTGKTNQLQITISGTKRSSNAKFDEPQLMRRPVQPKKLNISYGIASNAIGVPPAPTTQAPSMPYRITSDGEITKNVVRSSDDSHTKSVMSAPAAPPAAETPIESIDRDTAAATPETNVASKELPSKLLTSATATSFDCDDSERIAHSLTPDERRNSLLTELAEAENREHCEPMTKLPERGRRYPGLAASETIKFQLRTKSNTDSDEEAASVPIPTFRVDSPAKEATKCASDDDGAAMNIEVSDSSKDNDQQPPTSPTIQFERITNMSASPEKREHLYKILVIGELGTGKTSFIKRYVHQFFSQNYRATIGVDFALKVLNWDTNTIIRLQLWDIAGQERFGNMTRVYYKEAVGAFIVFDVTRSATFDAVIKWKQDLDSKVQLPNGSPIPCILLANKCDQAKQGIVNAPSKMDDYVKEHGFAGWFETSAKENINIEEAARALVNKILLNDKIINAGDLIDAEKFNLDGRNAEQSKKKCSC